MTADDVDDGNATEVVGADPAVVRAAVEAGDPFPGTGGFAGRLGDTLVRDVLGRRPLVYERADPASWSIDRGQVDDPTALPAGHVLHLGDGSEGAEPTDVWTLPDPDPLPEDLALARTESAVRESIREPDADGVAVAFSGGVDSALVAAGCPGAPCYVAGFEVSHDLAAAREAADAMDRDLTVVELSHGDIERAVPELVRATGRENAMDVAIAVPLYLVAERVAADGHDRLALGQGADELFGGYSKVVAPHEDHRVDAETVRGATRELLVTLPDQLPRDVHALRAAGVDPVAPLLHDRVVAAALRLPDHLLATEAERKVALRRAAEGIVPESVRTADKKAVQYGSYVARELDRLARRAGFKRRVDDNVGKYVRWLAAEAGVDVDGDVLDPEGL